MYVITYFIVLTQENDRLYERIKQLGKYDHLPMPVKTDHNRNAQLCIADI